MKKVYLLIAALALTVSPFSGVFAQPKNSKGAKKVGVSAQVNPLAAKLPASDAVFNVNIARLMNEGLPQALSAQPAYLQELNAKIDEIKTKFGVDLRQFDQLAVGIGYKKVSDKETDFEPVILASGKFYSAAYLGLTKTAASGKYREEKFGDQTIYVFSPKEILGSAKPQGANAKSNKILDMALKAFSKDVALAALDGNVLAIGSLEKVKRTLEGKTKTSGAILALANKNPNAAVSFGANMPNGMAQFIPLDNDEIGKNIGAINQMYGSMDFDANKMTVSLSAKTGNANAAKGLEEFLAGMQMVGKAMLGGSKRDDQKLYARLLENAVVARQGTDVSLNLNVPQSDVNSLMAILLKTK